MRYHHIIVLSPQFSVLGSGFWVVGSQFSVLTVLTCYEYSRYRYSDGYVVIYVQRSCAILAAVCSI